MSPPANPLPAPNVESQRALRLSIVTETYPPEINGVALSLQRFVKGLLARGHQIQLVRPRQPKNDAAMGISRASSGAVVNPQWQEPLATVVQNGIPLPFYRDLRLGLPAATPLQRLWSQAPPDLVHIVTEGPLGASALRTARRLGIPVTSGFHTNFHSYSHHYGLGFLRPLITAYLRRFHNHCHCTLVPTAALADELTANGFRNVRVIARGIDTEQFSPERRDPALRQRWGAQEEDPVMLYVGRLAAEKNIEFAATTFYAMRERNERARFVLVGDGPLKETLRARYPDLIFAGMQSGEALSAHYASADLFLFPSLTETFGNVILEAMASGLAVIAYNYAAAEQCIEHDSNGLCAPMHDEAAFRELALAAVADLSRVRQLGAAARRSAYGHSWQQITLDLERLFFEFAQGEPTP